jgi:hypothetical protein
MDQEVIDYRSARNLYRFFLFTSFVSFLYAAINGRLNGDFLGKEVTLPFWLLFLNFLFTIIPFFVLWKFYLHFKNKKTKSKLKIPLTALAVFLIFLMLLNILFTVFFGVGIMAAPNYEAPGYIKPFIQICNRFNYTYGSFIYIISVSKKNRTQVILILLLILLSYLRAGLGIFLYLGMLLYIKYFIEVNLFIRKRLLVLIFISLTFPFFVTFLYDIRDTLRSNKSEEVVADPILGSLFGRLSSFSDAAFILQEAPYFLIKSQELDPFYFQKQALGGVISQDFMPEQRPEKILFWFYYENLDVNVAYMAGTQGNLYMSFMKSPSIFLLNIFTILIYIYATLFLFSKLSFHNSIELGFMLLLYVVMSGVSNEYAFLLFSIFVYFVLFSIFNLFITKSKHENSLYNT